jgi:hypothetical protein
MPDRNTAFMTWNLMHLATVLKQVAGIPAHGKSTPRPGRGWLGWSNSEYRR